MKSVRALGVEFGNAICYSGYRAGQSPRDGIYPGYEQVVEDLKLLEHQWQYLRIYDCSRHADLVLEAIRNEDFDFKVMLGADVAAEMQSENCPWLNAHPPAVLERNRFDNDAQIDRLIELANRYKDIVFSVSVGNEATVEWSDHRVPLDRIIGFVRRVRQSVRQPVTFCENYVPWIGTLEPLAAELDFISLHTYPVWENRTIDDALEYSRQNYDRVAHHYPDKPIVITEAGWTTQSNGRGIEAWNACEEFQARYCRELLEWVDDRQILTFVFEAFDEPWKGSCDPMEPEKHWGLFTVDRKPKPVVQAINSRLSTGRPGRTIEPESMRPGRSAGQSAGR